MNYITLEELKLRDADKLPRTDSGELDDARCLAAIEDASSTIRTYLPSLIDSDGNYLEPPKRIKGTLIVIARDIVLYYLNERPGEEDAKARFQRAIKLLEALASGGSTLGGSAGSSGSNTGIEAIEDDSSEIIEGYCEFLPPSGRAH